jgi:hypothetical protein
VSLPRAPEIGDEVKLPYGGMLAGIHVGQGSVLELAVMLRRGDFADTADRIEAAIAAELPAVALTIDDRDSILSVLNDPPSGLGSYEGCSCGNESGGCERAWSRTERSRRA